MSRYEKHTWTAGALKFEVVLGRSTYSVALFDKGGRRIYWSGRKWGPSLTDALSSACYSGESERARGGINFLFTRIDGYADSPGIYDLWLAAQYVGETGAARHARYQPHRDACARMHALRFGGGWNAAKAEADAIKARLDAGETVEMEAA